MKIKGLGLNWKNLDTKSWVRLRHSVPFSVCQLTVHRGQSAANLNGARTAYKYRLRRPCNCAEPYNPDTIMRHCASSECSTGRDGTWYHVHCLKEQQDGLTRNGKMNPIADFPTKKPAKVVSAHRCLRWRSADVLGRIGDCGRWPSRRLFEVVRTVWLESKTSSALSNHADDILAGLW